MPHPNLFECFMMLTWMQERSLRVLLCEITSSALHHKHPNFESTLEFLGIHREKKKNIEKACLTIVLIFAAAS